MWELILYSHSVFLQYQLQLLKINYRPDSFFCTVLLDSCLLSFVWKDYKVLGITNHHLFSLSTVFRTIRLWSTVWFHLVASNNNHAQAPSPIITWARQLGHMESLRFLWCWQNMQWSGKQLWKVCVCRQAKVSSPQRYLKGCLCADHWRCRRCGEKELWA